MGDAGIRSKSARPGRTPSPIVSGVLRAASSAFGRYEAPLMRDYRTLTQGPGKLDHDDYVTHRLHDRALYPQQKDRLRFLSRAAHDALRDRCTDDRRDSTMADRWTCETLLRDSGLSTSTAIAVINSGGRLFGSLRGLDDAALLGDFLRERTVPVIATGNDRNAGARTLRIAPLGNGRYSVSGLGIVCVQALFAHLDDGLSPWLLYSEPPPHPEMTALFGSRGATATVRAVNFIAKGTVHTPAFIMVLHGDTGGEASILADLDPENGVVRKLTADGYAGLVSLSALPGTGVVLDETTLPDWDRVRMLVDRTGALFSPVAYHSVDIAITATGPVVSSVERGGTVDLYQKARGEGFLSDEIIDLFAACGVPVDFNRHEA